jgi:predicted XRE-type DNA-binding protein
MNWNQLIKDIQDTGFSQVQIATHCGCGQATISELARGITVQPSYAIGQALVALHKRVLRKVKAKSATQATSGQGA